MNVRLQEIIERGSPAQADLARQLVSAGTGSEAVDALYDAYLHDPYLTRD